MSIKLLKLAEKFISKYSEDDVDVFYRKDFIEHDPKNTLIDFVGNEITDNFYIRSVQNKLRQTTPSLLANGIWGISSYNALINYQKRNNLPADGKLNNLTFKSLEL